MSSRSIQVITCDECALESIDEQHSRTKGWIRSHNSSPYRPIVNGMERDRRELSGHWCSVSCYLQAMRTLYLEKGANASATEAEQKAMKVEVST